MKGSVLLIALGAVVLYEWNVHRGPREAVERHNRNWDAAIGLGILVAPVALGAALLSHRLSRR